jgi:hypothetical protein
MDPAIADHYGLEQPKELTAELIVPAQSVNQPTAHTTDKVTAASVGAAIIALLVAVLTQYGFEVDAVTASALTPFAVWLAGWMMKERIR